MIAILRETDRWLVEVTDTGPGIAVDAQARIFDPFIQIEQVDHKHTPGVGLGLAIVRQVASALGGNVSVRSQPGVGATFMFSLPDTER